MAKILQNEVVGTGAVGERVILDTLAHLDQTSRNKLKIRGLSKKITLDYLGGLIDENSTLKQAYWNTFHCSSILLQEPTGIIRTKFCKNRWCIVCNRIRTAKLLSHYEPTLNAMNTQVFVTLTSPLTATCKSKQDLSQTITLYNKTFAAIWRKMKRKFGRVCAVRKLEVTYNTDRDHFHPHFHVIMPNDKGQGTYVLNKWQKSFKSYSGALDIRKTDTNSGVELFKYFAKIFERIESESRNVSPYPASKLNAIFEVMRNKRIIQNYGGKQITNDTFSDSEGRLFFNEQRTEIWGYEPEQKTWVNGSGEII